MPRGTALTHQAPADIFRDNNPLVYIPVNPTKKAPEPMGTGTSWREKRGICPPRRVTFNPLF